MQKKAEREELDATIPKFHDELNKNSGETKMPKDISGREAMYQKL